MSKILGGLLAGVGAGMIAKDGFAREAFRNQQHQKHLDAIERGKIIYQKNQHEWEAEHQKRKAEDDKMNAEIAEARRVKSQNQQHTNRMEQIGVSHQNDVALKKMDQTFRADTNASKASDQAYEDHARRKRETIKLAEKVLNPTGFKPPSHEALLEKAEQLWQDTYGKSPTGNAWEFAISGASQGGVSQGGVSQGGGIGPYKGRYGLMPSHTIPAKHRNTSEPSTPKQDGSEPYKGRHGLMQSHTIPSKHRNTGGLAARQNTGGQTAPQAGSEPYKGRHGLMSRSSRGNGQGTGGQTAQQGTRPANGIEYAELARKMIAEGQNREDVIAYLRNRGIPIPPDL